MYRIHGCIYAVDISVWFYINCSSVLTIKSINKGVIQPAAKLWAMHVLSLFSTKQIKEIILVYLV